MAIPYCTYGFQVKLSLVIRVECMYVVTRLFTIIV